MGFLRLFAAPKRRLVLRSTLLGEAGWQRADFAETQTLDDRRNL